MFKILEVYVLSEIPQPLHGLRQQPQRKLLYLIRVIIAVSALRDHHQGQVQGIEVVANVFFRGEGRLAVAPEVSGKFLKGKGPELGFHQRVGPQRPFEIQQAGNPSILDKKV